MVVVMMMIVVMLIVMTTMIVMMMMVVITDNSHAAFSVHQLCATLYAFISLVYNLQQLPCEARALCITLTEEQRLPLGVHPHLQREAGVFTPARCLRVLL